MTGQSYSFTYDGRLPTVVTAAGLVNGRVAYGYTRDKWINSIAVTGYAPITFDYDADGLVKRGGQLTILRDSVTGVILGDTIGVVATSRTYDDHGALSAITLRVAGVETWSQRLIRDAIGRIIVQNDSDAAGITTTGYRYDRQDRLDQVMTNSAVSKAFTFDTMGNRIATTTSAGTVNATYAADDRITSYDGQPITHDASGARSLEVRGADTLRYEYDDFGRMTKLASTARGTLGFRYDAGGRRIQDLRAAQVVRQFLYGRAEMPIAEMTAEGSVHTEFVNVTGEIAPDYVIQGSTAYYLLRDQLGSVRRMIDVGTGTIVQTLDYDLNGVVTRNTAPAIQPFGFAGGLTDLDGRTVHFGAREYDARTGRWTSRDPVGFSSGDPNLYRYVHDDPVNSRDPNGLSAFCENLYRKIQNVQNAIDKRERELSDDPLRLPGACPGDDVKPSLSRRGHQRLINMRKANLAVLKAFYLARCGGKPPNGAPELNESWFNREYWEKVTGLSGAALIAYLVVSEGSRVVPIRNLVPVP